MVWAGVAQRVLLGAGVLWLGQPGYPHPCPPGPSEVWGKGLSYKRGFHTQAWPTGHAPGEATGGVEGGFPEAGRPREERGGQDVGGGEEGTGRGERAAGGRGGGGNRVARKEAVRTEEAPPQVLCTICGCEKTLLRQPEQDRHGQSMSRL